MEEPQKREDLIKKIRALLAKTVENGCTEEEALKAAEKAAELMAKYDLEMDEISVEEAGIDERVFPLDPALERHFINVCKAISELCGVRTWSELNIAGTRERQKFFGLPHDVEVAGYLAEICERAMKRELEVLRRECAFYTPHKRSRKIDSFFEGMSERLQKRIRELAWARSKATGFALVPVKDAVIEAEMQKRGIELRKSRLGYRDLDPHSYKSGLIAGDKVTLNPGVSDGWRREEAIE